MTRIDGERAVIVLAHGSPDPRHRAGVERLVRRIESLIITRASRELVAVVYLDHHPPRVAEVAATLADRGVHEAIVVPLLVTAGFHSRIDVPSAVAEISGGAPGCSVSLAEPFATSSYFPDAIAELIQRAGVPDDELAGVLVLGAGAKDPTALAPFERAAGVVSHAHNYFAVAGFIDGDPSPGAAETALIDAGCQRPFFAVKVAISEGIFFDRMVDSATKSGAQQIEGTLVDTDSLAKFALEVRHA